MTKEFISITAGDIASMSSQTKMHSSTDLSGRTAFGWTGVPIVARNGDGTFTEFGDAEFVDDGEYGYIVLVPGNRTLAPNKTPARKFGPPDA